MLDGAPLDGPRDLQRLVSSAPVGKKIRIRRIRGGRTREAEAAIGLYQER
jgi:S1-C subfamily serine protease